jgi:type II secretory pathway pseudopilin PulG
MEKSMQPQVASEKDKMVPIDTSGDPVDVELKDDEKKDDVKVEEQTEETKVEEEGFDNKKEVDEYGANVQKRIDKLTFKIREAERREKEAIRFAEAVNKENADLKSKVKDVDDGYLDEYSKRVTSEMEKAQAVLQDAINSGNAKKQVEAQQAIARLAIEEERANASKAQREKALKEQKNAPPVQQQPLQQAKPDPKAEAWAEKNSWFGANEAMTYTALSIHKKLLQEEGFDGKSDEYYKELDKRIREEFPHKFEDTNKKDRPAQAVASANRSVKSGRRTVRLTPSQVAIAKKLGVSLEDYAKHVKEA